MIIRYVSIVEVELQMNGLAGREGPGGMLESQNNQVVNMSLPCVYFFTEGATRFDQSNLLNLIRIVHWDVIHLMIKEQDKVK